MVSELESATLKKKYVNLYFFLLVFSCHWWNMMKYSESHGLTLLKGCKYLLLTWLTPTQTILEVRAIGWKKTPQDLCNALGLIDWCSPGAWWTGVCPAQLLRNRWTGRAESNSDRDVLFFLGGWGVIRMQRCVHANALFNSLWLSPYSPVSCPFLHFSPPLSVFFQICFWDAVHLSLWRSNWASHAAWPTATAHCWYPFNPAALKHLWYRWRKAAICRNQPRGVKL